MIILSNKLTTGEITFIFRIVIQILSYLGLYLLGRVVLGNAPRVAPLETHDVLNRFVGKSTTTLTSLRWIWKRIIRRNRDPIPSLALAFAFALALLYGVTVTVSDIGLIGIRSCTVAGPSHEDFPASIRSDSDALALVMTNMLNGTDPHSVNSYRCDAPMQRACITTTSGTQISLRRCAPPGTTPHTVKDPPSSLSILPIAIFSCQKILLKIV